MQLKVTMMAGVFTRRPTMGLLAFHRRGFRGSVWRIRRRFHSPYDCGPR